MNIRKFINEIRENQQNPDKKKVMSIVRRYEYDCGSRWSGIRTSLNARILNIAKLIQYLESNYTYVPANLYTKLVKYNKDHSRIINKEFRLAYSYTK